LPVIGIYKGSQNQHWIKEPPNTGNNQCWVGISFLRYPSNMVITKSWNTWLVLSELFLKKIQNNRGQISNCFWKRNIDWFSKNFLDQSRNYILSMCCCVGSTVNVGIDPSKIVITKLKLDKDHKTLLDWKGKGLTAEKSNLASLQTRMW
jgi:hypothetical protein